MSKSFINTSAAGHLHKNCFVCVCVSSVSPAQLLKILSFSWGVAEEPPSMRGVWVWTTVLFIIGGEQPGSKTARYRMFFWAAQGKQQQLCSSSWAAALCLWLFMCWLSWAQTWQNRHCWNPSPGNCIFHSQKQEKNGGKAFQYCNTAAQALPSQRQYSNRKRKSWNMKRASDS